MSRKEADLHSGKRRFPPGTTTRHARARCICRRDDPRPGRDTGVRAGWTGMLRNPGRVVIRTTRTGRANSMESGANSYRQASRFRAAAYGGSSGMTYSGRSDAASPDAGRSSSAETKRRRYPKSNVPEVSESDRARAFHVVPHFLFAGSKERTALVELLGADSLRVRMGRNGLEGGAERRLVDALQQDSNGIGSGRFRRRQRSGRRFPVRASRHKAQQAHAPCERRYIRNPPRGRHFQNKQGRAGHQMRHDTAGKNRARAYTVANKTSDSYISGAHPVMLHAPRILEASENSSTI